MIYRAQALFSQNLLLLPETGMGYQIIDAKRIGRSSSDRFIVYNSELIVDFNGDFHESKRKILNEGYTKMFNQSSVIELSSPSLVSRSEVRNVRMFTESTMNTKGRHTGGTGAVYNNPIYGNGTDKFIRLSPYKDDKRIDFERMRLREGSFTTTEADYLACRSYNDDPIDRYALPSDDAIEWVFTIKPTILNRYRPGIVQPANNHNGGGIEALFDDGTSDGTFLGRTSY